ncbi:MAG: ABC transporter permease subunit [Candidatus Nomurabacteria bacterium]|jgi:NitT/TauT family transport system permease protein|nr:ABC transporter permease subunit [Candidatus Nomurabacteria bacterium]
MRVSPKNKFSPKTIFGKPSTKALLWVLLLLIIWELAAQLDFVPVYILPPFSKVITTLWYEIFNGNLPVMVGRSLFVLIEALAVSLGISIVVIWLCRKSKTFNSFYSAVSAMMNSIPSMALLPLIIMWLGIGDIAIIALVTHSVLWTFTIYINEGINAIPKIYREFAENINLSTFKQLKDVYLPAILPNIVSGLKIVWGRGWRSLIGAEIVFGAIGAAGGLGYFINISRLNGNMSRVLAGIVIIAIIGIIVDYGIFRRISVRMKKWGMKNE